MSPLTWRAFLHGPDAYREAGLWHPLTAISAAFAVIVAGQSVPVLGMALLSMRLQTNGGQNGSGGAVQVGEPETLWLLLASQTALVLLTLALASLRRSQPMSLLHLGWPDGGLRAFGFAFLLMLPLLVAFNGLAYGLSPDGFVADFREFIRMAKGPDPLVSMLTIAAGAPAWEEMLFRGFLLGPLCGAFGFWPGAALVSGGWSLLHLNYSLAGLAEVFLMGLYFAWLLRRTGSLWVPMACHAVYNASLFLVMRHLAV